MSHVPFAVDVKPIYVFLSGFDALLKVRLFHKNFVLGCAYNEQGNDTQPHTTLQSGIFRCNYAWENMLIHESKFLVDVNVHLFFRLLFLQLVTRIKEDMYENKTYHPMIFYEGNILLSSVVRD